MREAQVVGKKALKALHKPPHHRHGAAHICRRQGGDLDYDVFAENVLYNEPASRGYKEMVGKRNRAEIDFVVTKGGRRGHIHMAHLMPTLEVVSMGEEPILMLKNNCSKFIITINPLTVDSDRIESLNPIDDFLLGDRFGI